MTTQNNDTTSTLLDDVSISDYIAKLKAGSDVDFLNKINSELSNAIGNNSGGMDLHLFSLQKDLLLFQCKFFIAKFEFDDPTARFFEKKINMQKKLLDAKLAKVEKRSPYKSFLTWVLSVEKYLGFSIDRTNDLTYLVEATKQMLNFYESQKAEIEKQKSKRR